MTTLAFMWVAAPAAAAQFNPAGELVRVILSLIAIVALIVAAGWISRRLQRRPGGSGGRRIHCVESFAVGTRERLLLIEADGQRLLVGTGPGGMRTLHVYDAADVPAVATVTDVAPTALPVPKFAELLARWKRRA